MPQSRDGQERRSPLAVGGFSERGTYSPVCTHPVTLRAALTAFQGQPVGLDVTDTGALEGKMSKGGEQGSQGSSISLFIIKLKKALWDSCDFQGSQGTPRKGRGPGSGAPWHSVENKEHTLKGGSCLVRGSWVDF